MTEIEIVELERLISSFVGDDERFAITNQSLRVLASAVAARLRIAGSSANALRRLARAAASARQDALARATEFPELRVIRESDAARMMIECPKNYPKY